MLSRIPQFLTFDDVGLIPRMTKIISRSIPSLQTKLGRDVYQTPWIPANMDTIIGSDLANVCLKQGGCVIFHRFSPIEEKISLISKFPDCYQSIGVKDETLPEWKQLYDVGCRRFCIDIAHGHTQMMIDRIKEIKSFDSTIQIIAGNVCTDSGVYDLGLAGADIIKIGVGPGSACITRMMTAVGVPQFSAIQMANQGKLRLSRFDISVKLIADGGIKHPRDGVLALAAGADAVMMGNIFAKTFESAMEKITKDDGTIYGRYRGQASAEFMNEYYGDKKKGIAAEGVAFNVPITGGADDIFDLYNGGLRSAMTYCNSYTIDDLHNNAEFFSSTSNYMIESNHRSNF